MRYKVIGLVSFGTLMPNLNLGINQFHKKGSLLNGDIINAGNPYEVWDGMQYVKIVKRTDTTNNNEKYVVLKQGNNAYLQPLKEYRNLSGYNDFITPTGDVQKDKNQLIAHTAISGLLIYLAYKNWNKSNTWKVGLLAVAGVNAYFSYNLYKSIVSKKTSVTPYFAIVNAINTTDEKLLTLYNKLVANSPEFGVNTTKDKFLSVKNKLTGNELNCFIDYYESMVYLDELSEQEVAIQYPIIEKQLQDKYGIAVIESMLTKSA